MQKIILILIATVIVMGSVSVLNSCKKNTEVVVTGISLNRDSLMLKVNEIDTLKATVTPNNAIDKTVTWRSSNSLVTTVDKNGKVTAIKEGEAIITASASNAKATCSVTVHQDM